MLDTLDQTLERIIRDWIATEASSRADLAVRPERRGGPPSFEVIPRNPAALPITLWVADDGAHIAFSIGGGSWWADHIALETAAVREVLSAIGSAHAGEEVRRVGHYIIGRKGYVDLAPGRRLQYNRIGFFSLIPGIPWTPVHYEPY